MVTVDDIVRYLSETHAAQSVEAMRSDMPRWIRRLAKYGVADVPLVLGSTSQQYVDAFALQASRNSDVKVRAHDVRDTLPKIRRYKGR